MNKRIVTFGEMLLRLTTPGNLRLQQARYFDANFGGSEVNVAISVATYGETWRWLRRCPTIRLAAYA